MDERNRFDREIDALLDVEPSPDFVARVRERVEGESMTRRAWLPGRWLIGAAVIAAALIVVSVAMWSDRPAPAEPPSIRAEGRPAMPAPSPEVLVSPAEAALVQRLLVAAREARVEPAPGPRLDAPLNPPMSIVIEPIMVEPLLVADHLEPGAQQ